MLAREHHDLERSIIGSSMNIVNNNNNPNESIHVNGCSLMLSAQENLPPSQHLPLSFSRTRSLAGLSDTTATDMDEYFDAFDEEEENVMVMEHSEANEASDRTLGHGERGEEEVSAIDGGQQQSELQGALKHSNTGTFHTAREQTYVATTGSSVANDVTINDSISTLSADSDEEHSSRTLASIEMDSFSR